MWKRDASLKPVPLPSPEPPPASPPLTHAPTPSAENVAMNLGKSVMIKGELNASEDLTLCGDIEGRITLSDHTLTIGPEADIRAEIAASTVVILGRVSGNVTASKKIEIRATGSVIGDILCPRIVIADGGQIVGKVQMTGENTQRV